MSKILVFLPETNFDLPRYERVIKVINGIFRDSQIIHFVHKNSTIKYRDILGVEVNIYNKRFLDDNFFRGFTKLEGVVLLKDSNDKNIDLQWQCTLSIDFYRDFLDGYGGLRIVGEKTKRTYEKWNRFYQISTHHLGGIYYTPFGYLSNLFSFGDVNEFGFRIAHDLEALKKRDDHHIVIAFFGGSGGFDIFANTHETITYVLEQKLNSEFTSKGLKFSVLNFSICGNTVLNEMINYLLFAEALSPEIVIAHDGYNDLHFSQGSNPLLLREYDISYCQLISQWGAILDGESQFSSDTLLRFQNSASQVILSYYRRKKEFEDLVQKNGSIFISALQPTIHQKSGISDTEKSYQDRFDSSTSLPLQKNIPFLYEKFLSILKQQEAFSNFVCFDEALKPYGRETSLFGDYCHQLPEANKIIANTYYKKVRSFYANS